MPGDDPPRTRTPRTMPPRTPTPRTMPPRTPTPRSIPPELTMSRKPGNTPVVDNKAARVVQIMAIAQGVQHDVCRQQPSRRGGTTNRAAPSSRLGGGELEGGRRRAAPVGADKIVSGIGDFKVEDGFVGESVFGGDDAEGGVVEAAECGAGFELSDGDEAAFLEDEEGVGGRSPPTANPTIPHCPFPTQPANRHGEAAPWGLRSPTTPRPRL